LTEKGYYKYEWKIGTGKHFKLNVCRDAFMISYDIRPTYLQELCHNIKNENINMDKEITEKQNDVGNDKSNHIYNELIKFTKLKGIKLSLNQLAAMQIPNTEVISIYVF
jgi:hypothetical protein